MLVPCPTAINILPFHATACPFVVKILVLFGTPIHVEPSDAVGLYEYAILPPFVLPVSGVPTATNKVPFHTTPEPPQFISYSPSDILKTFLLFELVFSVVHVIPSIEYAIVVLYPLFTATHNVPFHAIEVCGTYHHCGKLLTELITPVQFIPSYEYAFVYDLPPEGYPIATHIFPLYPIAFTLDKLISLYVTAVFHIIPSYEYDIKLVPLPPITYNCPVGVVLVTVRFPPIFVFP